MCACIFKQACPRLYPTVEVIAKEPPFRISLHTLLRSVCLVPRMTGKGSTRQADLRIQRGGRPQPAEHGRRFVVDESKFASTTVLGKLMFFFKKKNKEGFFRDLCVVYPHMKIG